jgi:hypothetical protein
MSIKQYDVAISIDENTPEMKIMRHIQPNSIVLEFGPAYGRMTKYMKETLDCKVYIVVSYIGNICWRALRHRKLIPVGTYTKMRFCGER